MTVCDKSVEPCDECDTPTPSDELERCEMCGAYVCRECMGENARCIPCEEKRR